MSLFECLPFGRRFADVSPADDLEHFAKSHMLTPDTQLGLSALLLRVHEDGQEAAAPDDSSTDGPGRIEPKRA